MAAGFGLLLATVLDPVINDSLAAKGVLFGAVLVNTLVVLRQFLAFGENRRLTQHLTKQSETLELRVHERTTELEVLSNKYRYDALHDALIGLPNRRTSISG